MLQAKLNVETLNVKNVIIIIINDDDDYDDGFNI